MVSKVDFGLVLLISLIAACAGSAGMHDNKRSAGMHDSNKRSAGMHDANKRNLPLPGLPGLEALEALKGLGLPIPGLPLDERDFLERREFYDNRRKRDNFGLLRKKRDLDAQREARKFLGLFK